MQFSKTQVTRMRRALAVFCLFAVIWLYAPKFFDKQTVQLIFLGFGLVAIWAGYFIDRRKKKE